MNGVVCHIDGVCVGGWGACEHGGVDASGYNGGGKASWWVDGSRLGGLQGAWGLTTVQVVHVSLCAPLLSSYSGCLGLPAWLLDCGGEHMWHGMSYLHDVGPVWVVVDGVQGQVF